ncbi:MAG: twin-arginine translocase TatA/TatE family subunit [Candidatus Melainabacteria bacterium]|jgi:sec-independent protein translocase protein TatA
MPFNLGFPELILIFAIGLLLFGPKKLPELGKSLGDALSNFKKSFHKASEDETKLLTDPKADSSSDEKN